MTSLPEALEHALDTAPEGLVHLSFPLPSSGRDLFRALEVIYDLSRGPLDPLDGRARYATSPALANVRHHLEEAWLSELLSDELEPVVDVVGTVAALVASSGLHGRVVADPSFDSLELTLATAFDVTRRIDTLPGRLSDALGRDLITSRAEHRQSTGALSVHDLADAERSDELVGLSALAGLVGLNHWLAPEGLGVLVLHQLTRAQRGAFELEVYERLGGGPRSQALEPRDPDAVVVLASVLEDMPHWGPRVVRGARWYRDFDAVVHA